jgi:hypothetical protein
LLKDFTPLHPDGLQRDLADSFQACRDMITYTLLGKPDAIIKAEMKALFLEVDAILQKVPSKFEEIKNKIALLEGGKDIIREMELRFARYGLI